MNYTKSSLFILAGTLKSACTELVYIFINNSNFFSQGVSTIRRIEKLGYNYLKMDYGQLIKRVKGKRMLDSEIVIVGLQPQLDDSLWKSDEYKDYAVKVFDRSQFRKKGEVNAFFTRKINEIILTKAPGVLALIIGDCSHFPVIAEAFKHKWKVETWSWNLGMKIAFKCTRVI